MWITIVHFHIVFKLQLSVWVHRRKKVIYIWDGMRMSKWFILGWSVSLTAVEVTKDTMCMVNIIIKTSKARNRKKNSSHHKWQLDWPLTCSACVHANQRQSCSHQTDCFKAHRVSDEIPFSAAWFLAYALVNWLYVTKSFLLSVRGEHTTVWKTSIWHLTLKSAANSVAFITKTYDIVVGYNNIFL